MVIQGICIIVGYGHMGKKIVEILRLLNFAIILIDPALEDTENKDETENIYSNINEIPLEKARQARAWFVCTPTATHFEILSKILSKFPDSRIMVEKPACTRCQINGLVRLSSGFNLENIWINNHYADCNNLEVAIDFIKSRNYDCHKIVIDFCKNRANDVINGRYIDEDFMLWGYEGFHMLHIVTQLIRERDARDFIEMQGKFKYFKGNDSQISWIIEHGKLASGLEILLRTSTDGSIFEPTFKKGILKQNQRLRRANVVLKDGTQLFLKFGESREKQFAPSQEYCFGWQIGETHNKTEYWQKDSPLKKHIERFVQGAKNSANLSSFYHALQLTKRLSDMTAISYLDNTSRLTRRSIGVSL